MFNSLLLNSIHIESKIAPHIGDRAAYIPWNPGFIESAIDLLRFGWVGPAFNISIFIFMVVGAVYLAFKIVHWLAG